MLCLGDVNLHAFCYKKTISYRPYLVSEFDSWKREMRSHVLSSGMREVEITGFSSVSGINPKAGRHSSKR